MFNFKDDKPLSRDKILSLVSEEEIFERYLGLKVDYSRPFCNPKRNDKYPGCWFYIDDRGRIKFIDHSHSINWDCFNVVEYVERTNFAGALRKIATDFGIINGEVGTRTILDVNQLVNARKQKERLEIRIKRRDWNKVDEEIWYNRYTFTRKYLNSVNISPVSNAWWYKAGGNVLEQFYSYKPHDPCYAYHFGEYDYKLYFPYRSKGNKFRQVNATIIQGLNLLPEKGHILIITKSYKDVVAIKLFQSQFDIYSVAPMSENIMIPSNLIEDWKTSFDYIFTLFDFDRTGIKAMRRYEREYGIPWLLFGKEYNKKGIKDFADHLEKTKIGLDLTPTFNLMKNIYERVIG